MIVKIRNLAFLITFFFSGCYQKNTIYENKPDFKNTEIYEQTNQTMQNSSDFLKNKASNISFDKYVNTKIGGDCSGLVEAINSENQRIYFQPKELSKHYTNTNLKSEALFNLYLKNNKISFSNPKHGDLIFFINTTDKTKYKSKKIITHVGVVDEIQKDGTIVFVHNSGGKNIKSVMNLNLKNYHIKGGKKVNAYMISKCKSKQCLSSNLFAGYGIL